MNINCVHFFPDLRSYLKSQRLSYLQTTKLLYYVRYWHKVLLLINNLKHFNTTCKELSLTESRAPRNQMGRKSLAEMFSLTLACGRKQTLPVESVSLRF